ncbi:MAG TPA: FHA domain-containing protein [Planctomycetaceae bacterium]|nr:FHA domain-containing protein [Planctomycetaceae bacterium]
MLDVQLKVASGRHHGQVIPLRTRKFLIGREQDCQLRTNSDLVSRHHCVFAVDDFAVRLRDLGSTNGTLVNGERIREVVLKAGDRVQIGKLDFEVVITGKQVAEAAAPAPVAVEMPGDVPAVDERETLSLSAEETQYELQTPPVAPTPAETQYEIPIAASSGDTTILQGPAADQQPLAYPPGYAPPAGMYPQWPYGAPGQYYGAPYGGGYAPPGYPPQMPYPGYPQQQYPASPPQPVGAGPKGQALIAPPIRLPPPEHTGASAPPPPPPPPEAKSDTAQPAEPAAMTPSQRAAEIIKQRTRRPSGS